MGSNEALALGRLRAGLPDKVRIIRKDDLDGATPPGTIARTTDYIEFAPGKPAFLCLTTIVRGCRVRSGTSSKRQEVSGGRWLQRSPLWRMPRVWNGARPPPDSSTNGQANSLMPHPISTFTSRWRTAAISSAHLRHYRIGYGSRALAMWWSAPPASSLSARSSTHRCMVLSGWCSKASQSSSRLWSRIRNCGDRGLRRGYHRHRGGHPGTDGARGPASRRTESGSCSPG